MVLAATSACTVISSNSTTHHSGVSVSDETLAQLETGKTTKGWVVATLGPPTSATSVNEKTEILKYTSIRTRKSSSGFILVISAHNENEEKETVFLEFQDGILQRYWKET